MQMMTHRDVQFAVLLVSQACETTTHLMDQPIAREMDELGTAVLQLAGMAEHDRDSDEALLEALRRIYTKAEEQNGHASPPAIWRLIMRKASVADAFIRAYRDQQAEVAAMAKLIDDEAGD